MFNFDVLSDDGFVLFKAFKLENIICSVQEVYLFKNIKQRVKVTTNKTKQKLKSIAAGGARLSPTPELPRESGIGYV